MTEHSPPRMKRASVLFLLFCLFSLSACVSHLKEAKFYYAQGQRFSRQYQTEKAVASFKRRRRLILVMVLPPSMHYVLV